jgi:cytochrome b6-f complex iron-sulfur subunit
MNGVNFEGPAPRPLERFRVYVDPVDGKVVVDKTVKCQVELGTCDTSQFWLPA